MKEVEYLIESAFGQVSLGKGNSIRQCAALDDRLDKDDPKYSHLRDYPNWQDIPDTQIEYIGTHGVFVFGGNESIVFHLPAAMKYVLKYYKGFLNPIKPFDVYMAIHITLEGGNSLSLLTCEQTLAVKEYLNCILVTKDEPFAEDEVRVLLSRI